MCDIASRAARWRGRLETHTRSYAKRVSRLSKQIGGGRGLGGHAADRDGDAEAARPSTPRIEKECAVLCLDLSPASDALAGEQHQVRGSTLVPTDQFAGLDAQSLREALRPKSQSGVDQFARQFTLPFFVCRKAY